MPILLVLTVLVVAGTFAVFRGKGGGDAPARITTLAANQLPPHRGEWGIAMAAELAHVHGRARRWCYTAGVLRVALFPPPRHPGRVVVVALAGLLAAAAATVAAASEVPTLSVFVAVLSLLLCAYLTVAASRAGRPRPTAPRLIVGAVGLAGVAAAVAAVVRIAAADPAATTDSTHVFSILSALALTGYLTLALTPPRLGGDVNRRLADGVDRRLANSALWWGLAAALAGGAVWAVAALANPAAPEGVTGLLSPVGVATTLAAAAGASAATGSRQAGAQAGLLTAVLGAPIQFAVDMTTLLQLHHYTLATAYDVNAYAHSGYPNVASYVLSDALAGGILAGLVLYPFGLLICAVLGAMAGTRLRRLAAKSAAHPTA